MQNQALPESLQAGGGVPPAPQSRPPPSHAHSMPLALDQIRPRANSENHDISMGSTYRENVTPGNCSYVAPWPIFAFDWCKWTVHGGSTPGGGAGGLGSAGKMAIGSYLEDPHNFIQILDTQINQQDMNTSGGVPYGVEYVKVAEATCSYPVTRILWEPPSASKQSDLLATAGDHLRLWSLPNSSQASSQTLSNSINRTSTANQRGPPTAKLTPLALLSNSKTPEHTAPLTSLDWNQVSPKLIITSSIDTTCTIWDIPTLTAKTQLIAHDKEVFDVRFCAGSVDVFVSCGADGSVRMFDLRSLEHSTIIYEPAEKPDPSKDTPPTPSRNSPTKTPATTSSSATSHTLTTPPPLLRLASSPHDAHLLATFAADSPIVRILDVRQPGQALLELRGHSAAVNAVEWAPSRRGVLVTGADDCQVLGWDLLGGSGAALDGPAQGGNVAAKGPMSAWKCDYEVSNLSWAPHSSLTGHGGEWVGVVGGRGVWGVKL
ncbi:WD40 repeat-like protein [Eremomyces bilateralis CBS 781.70]|uniref:WD40 repeat-like protein n=1 Tax=Eremomyces bilateralis CBS 781.70 TaxID=1392243 RepID=A0A6G1GGH1_9PEZI|nr:WD40 repeat-like protein [Eremomyces bilateralis CBS 781.70]KAF1817026.1 WD40 repeat-like protein [Eremomyces bilateralis CBS 781.70]